MSKQKECRKNGKSYRLRILSVILACVIFLSGAALAILQFCTPAGKNLKPSEWFGNANDSFVLNHPEENQGIELLSSVIDTENYEEYGVSAQAESAVYLQFTDIQPANATDTTVTWRVSFINPNVPWASGKTASNYVSVTPSADTLSAVAECRAPFGARIWIVASFDSNPNLVYRVECDYKAKISNIGITLKRHDDGILTNYLIVGTQNYAYEPQVTYDTTDSTIPITIEISNSYTIGFTDGIKFYTSAYSQAASVMVDLTQSGSFTADYAFLRGFFRDGSNTAKDYPKWVSNWANELDYATSSPASSYKNQHFFITQDYTLKQSGEAIGTGTARGFVAVRFYPAL